MCMQICLCGGMGMWVEDRRRHQIPWSSSYRQLRTDQCGCWTRGPPQEHLIWEHCLFLSFIPMGEKRFTATNDKGFLKFSLCCLSTEDKAIFICRGKMLPSFCCKGNVWQPSDQALTLPRASPCHVHHDWRRRWKSTELWMWQGSRSPYISRNLHTCRINTVWIPGTSWAWSR